MKSVNFVQFKKNTVNHAIYTEPDICRLFEFRDKYFHNDPHCCFIESTFHIYDDLMEHDIDNDYEENGHNIDDYWEITEFNDEFKEKYKSRINPKITCLIIEDVDRGIDNYELFANIVSFKYPNLKELYFHQNFHKYSTNYTWKTNWTTNFQTEYCDTIEKLFVILDLDFLLVYDSQSQIDTIYNNPSLWLSENPVNENILYIQLKPVGDNKFMIYREEQYDIWTWI